MSDSEYTHKCKKCGFWYFTWPGAYDDEDFCEECVDV